ncbi:MAG: Thioredoxin [Promethearchaeota archaeon]|nr:MAG: Thioredoxin [Candidatus Lokiarchaeota archaeon]
MCLYLGKETNKVIIMSSTERNEKIIKNEMGKLKNSISVKIFTDYKMKDGEKTRRCMSCDGVLNTLDLLVKHSNGKFDYKEISVEEDEDLAKQHKVNRIPTILFLSDENKELIRYSAIPQGQELVPFLRTLQYYSGKSPFYKDQIISNLQKIKDSDLKLFITQTCPYCPQVVPVVTLFAIVTNGKVHTEIIDLDANPNEANKYKVSGTPHAIINEDKNIYGMFNPQDLLDTLVEGKRDIGGMYA